MQQVWLCKEWPTGSFSAHYLLSHSISPLLSQRPLLHLPFWFASLFKLSMTKNECVVPFTVSGSMEMKDVLCKQEPLLLQFQTIGAKQRLTSLKPFFTVQVLLSGFCWLKYCFSSFVTGLASNVYIALPISALYCFCHSVSDSIHFHFIALLLPFNLWPLLKMNAFVCRMSGKRVESQGLGICEMLCNPLQLYLKVVMENYKMPEIRSLFWRTLTCLWIGKNISLTKIKKKEACWEWLSWCFPNTFFCWLFYKHFCHFCHIFTAHSISQFSSVGPRCLHEVLQKPDGDWVRSRTQQCSAARSKLQCWDISCYTREAKSHFALISRIH